MLRSVALAPLTAALVVLLASCTPAPPMDPADVAAWEADMRERTEGRSDLQAVVYGAPGDPTNFDLGFDRHPRLDRFEVTCIGGGAVVLGWSIVATGAGVWEPRRSTAPER